MRFEELDYHKKNNALYRLYNRLNKGLFSNQLPSVVIDFQNIDNRYADEAVYGMFFPNLPYAFEQKPHILFSHELECVIRQQKTQSCQIEAITQIMLHEMIHFYCYTQKINDSRHNEAWQQEALKHGLLSIYKDDVLQEERLLPVSLVVIASFRF